LEDHATHWLALKGIPRMKRLFRNSILVAAGIAVTVFLTQQSVYSQTIYATQLFATEAGERQGLAYDSATDRLYTIERATTLVAPQMRVYTLAGTLVGGPYTLSGTSGALTRMGLHFIRTGTNIGGQAAPAGSLIYLRDATLYILNKNNGNVIASEAVNVNFDTGGLCVRPLNGGGKGLGYSTTLGLFLSTNSCCNCSGVAEFNTGQVTGFVPISVPATNGGGDVKEHPLSGNIVVANSPGSDSFSVLSPARALLRQYVVLDGETLAPFGVMRIAFDATGDRMWLLGFDGNVYQINNPAVGVPPGPIPVIERLALNGIYPNPSNHQFEVSFLLPSGAPARLELWDVAGRRVLAREVGSLGAGDHVVNFNGRSLPAGVYMVRLTQDGRSVSKKAIIVR